MITLYGISNCDTIKKAKKWLDEQNIAYHFHDYRKQGIDETLIHDFFQHFDWQMVVNKRGTTYRQLSEEQKVQLTKESASELLIAQPAMIKRPILIATSSDHSNSSNRAMMGFSLASYQAFFE